MSFEPMRLAKRLREARENRHLSQQDVADVVGLQRTAISLIEAGKRAVSTLEIAQLADLYEIPISDFFAEGESQVEEPMVVLHRALPGLDSDPAIRKEIDHCIHICRTGAELERLLDRPARLGPPEYKLHENATAISQGATIADKERQRLGLGVAPVPDAAELLTLQGIWACATTLPNGVSGLFLRLAGVGMIVVVNARDPAARRRFSFIHEYGHALMDRAQSLTVSSNSNQAQLTEIRANSFAAAFLMPADGVADFLRSFDRGRPSRERFAWPDATTGRPAEVEDRNVAKYQAVTHQDAARLAHYFGVAYSTAAYRLHNLGYVNRSRLEALLEDEEQGRAFLRELRMPDPENSEQGRERETASDRELKGEVLHLAIEAYRQEKISRGRLQQCARLLGLGPAWALRQAESLKS